ncbi:MULTISPECIES: Holliday junction branch migration protein RuvA [unclassified Luteibacter]|uniref:Holliday junction branch migration protein RuvA n=1 Tax=unclassified Luteibacter TaxID=2620188 RepID=UPI0008BF4987|nr:MULTISPECIES: Holliday junction branch migration protein RuvA [unclassified Luteibacter]MDR6938306.1 Holliday junction DNA helicase RuvA [Luteibacter sp. 3190]SEP10349.1 Holliday junction DNA helicase subunit RuvA [Luteibacter sp. UNC138MFCol5.1]SEW05323.1 Holliday junction DNA helicase subunit RuvA [Luteibacter sp. 329MFSha]
MIGRLRGTLITKQPPSLLIEVGGVGYEVDAPMSTIYDLPATGKEVTLLTHYAVKEDGVALYGFLREAERAMFRHLLKVSGIGAKIALAVLSGVATDELSRLVHAGDVVALTKIPGIGKKTAERMVVELRDRVDAVGVRLPVSAVGDAAPVDPVGEATVALQQLGYKPVEASRLVQKAAADGDTAEAIIRKALRAALGT